jgi:hypothetical protein
MGLGGEGPRGYEAGWISGLGNGAAEPGVAVKCVILTLSSTNLALAVEALPLPLPITILLTMLLKLSTLLSQLTAPLVLLLLNKFLLPPSL